jgi:hypothetical protein
MLRIYMNYPIDIKIKEVICMKRLSHFSIFEKGLFVTAALFIVSFLAYGISERFMHGGSPVSSESNTDSVTYQKNEIPKNSFNSSKKVISESSQLVLPGDSVFSSKDSRAHVKLKNGSDIVVGPNSLIVFTPVKNESKANLIQGNFRLSVKSQAKVAIRGNVAKISGDHPELQVYIGPDLTPKLKVLSGEAIVHLDEKESPVTIKAGETVIVSEPSQEELVALTPIVIAPEVRDALRPDPLLGDAPLVLMSSPLANIKTNSRKIASEKEEPPSVLTQEPTIDTPSEEIKLKKSAEVEKPSERTRADTGLVKDFWIWAGTGVNFTNYSQTVPGLSTVNFGRISIPSQVFRAGFFFDDNFALDLAYKNSPGEVSGGSTIAVSNGHYAWKTMSAEILYRPTNFDAGKKSEWLWRAGVQQHEMPFIVPLTANSISIEKNSMTALSAGVEFRKFTRKRVRVEAMLRYQQPISSSADVGTSFEVKPKLNFDGSLGAAYELKPNMFLGAYWSGQYSSFKFDYKNTGGTSFSGSQNLFMTNFDIRLGMEF